MSNNYDGNFITLEGLDASGKSSIVSALEEQYNITTTSEPSDEWTGKALREALQDEDTPPLSDFFMFLGDRAMHLENTVIPALEAGEMVICDRYIDSTTAYQGHMLQDVFECPEMFIEWVQGRWVVEPDLTLYIDIDVETSVRRAEGVDKYERTNTLESVKKTYDERVRPLSRVVTIDGEQDFNKVLDDCIRAISAYESEATCAMKEHV